MKKLIFIFVAIFALCSCSKDEEIDNFVNQNTMCLAECYFDSYYDNPIPSYKIQSLTIDNNYTWPYSNGTEVKRVDATLITINYYNENNKSTLWDSQRIYDNLRNIKSPDYLTCHYNDNPSIQIVCMHGKTRNKYNKYRK